MKKKVKGGILIDLDGVEAFLPGSQIDIGPVKNLDDLIDQEYDFKILKINQERHNIVVSRRELLEESRKDMRAQFLKEMKVGELRKGKVKNITDFGAFIDLGGVDGLLHITDMSWGRITNPKEMLEVGQEIEVMVLDIDFAKERVSLGLKQKSANPWDEVETKYPVGTTVKAIAVKTDHLHTAPGIAIDDSGEATLSATLPGATIYYLVSSDENAQFTYTDGMPTNGTLYDPSNKPTLATGEYIKAVAVNSFHEPSSPAVATRQTP